ncbi:unnamed protein product [Psylliodes chrysocephalus]|uniref:Uncharacterized protein n=1 Tax=Psylliodes chrysocephalus TaxID=3402493 RepID=A0A9P0GHE0_9CUCU|nr:unnamed protein product [Psylliodes chrysocephala]
MPMVISRRPGNSIKKGKEEKPVFYSLEFKNSYPDRVLLGRKIFVNIHRRLTESGNFKRNTSVGRPQFELQQLKRLSYLRSKRTSTRKIGREFFLSTFESISLVTV